MTNFFKVKMRKHRVKRKGVDFEATKARKFKNYRSRVMLDGREVLFGADYKRRVREVEERDGYRCQWYLHTIDTAPPKDLHCGAPSNGHPHHLVKRSDGRDDRASNLISICDSHHKLAHPEHRTRFGEGRKQGQNEE